MINQTSIPLISPDILKKEARERPLDIFLCGPGADDPKFDIRQTIRSFLTENYNCRVVLGEDIPTLKRFHRRKANLQAIEWKYAHVVDFTILLLESAGAIAELGAFSRTPDIRPRLFVVIPARHFNNQSYISRGPLSEIAEYSTRNIIYYHSNESPKALIQRLLFHITLYKYVKYAYSREYMQNAIFTFYKDFEPGSYEPWFQRLRSEFIDRAILALTNILNRPTFTELVRHSELEPNVVSTALHHLLSGHNVQKVAGGRYAARMPFSDPLLVHFNSTEMSKARARMIALT